MDSNTMKMIKEEVVNLIEQFFREQKWEKALSGMKEDVMTIKPPFSARRFEELITSTDLKSATKYLSGYTKSQTNELSNILFYYLHRQETANDMCIGDPFALERFSSGGGFEPRPDTATFISRARSEFVERVRAIQLVTKTLDDIIARMRKFALVLQTELITESKRLIPQIPDFDSGSVSSCRLIELLNQSLQWQHSKCLNRLADPVFTTLAEDHKCVAPQLLPQHIFDPQALQHNFDWESLLASPLTQVPPSAPLAQPLALVPSASPQVSCGSNSTTNPMPPQKYGKRKACNSLSGNASKAKSVVKFNYPSPVEAMAFHPGSTYLLLIGLRDGSSVVLDVSQEFQEVAECAIFPFEAHTESLSTLGGVSVTSVAWAPPNPHNTLDATFGVAFSEKLVQLYALENNALCFLREIVADEGRVISLAFDYIGDNLQVITCGDDGQIKFFDFATGALLKAWVEHHYPILSMALHPTLQSRLIFTSTGDGYIYKWTNTTVDPFHHVSTPTKIMFGGGERLFSCSSAFPKSGTSIYELNPDNMVIIWNREMAAADGPSDQVVMSFINHCLLVADIGGLHLEAAEGPIFPFSRHRGARVVDVSCDESLVAFADLVGVKILPVDFAGEEV